MENNKNKCPLEPFFQNWFVSSCLKEKNMQPNHSKNSVVFFIPKSWDNSPCLVIAQEQEPTVLNWLIQELFPGMLIQDAS